MNVTRMSQAGRDDPLPVDDEPTWTTLPSTTVASTSDQSSAVPRDQSQAPKLPMTRPIATNRLDTDRAGRSW